LRFASFSFSALCALLAFLSQRSALCSLFLASDGRFALLIPLSALCALLPFLYQRSALCSLFFLKALRFASFSLPALGALRSFLC
jgi:hypothetical protein